MAADLDVRSDLVSSLVPEDEFAKLEALFEKAKERPPVTDGEN